MNFSASFSDPNIFNALLSFFMGISSNGITAIIPYASYLICILGIIDLCTSWYLYDGELKFSVMISKIIKIGAFYFLVVHWGDITGAISKSFAYIGYIAGGHSIDEAAKLIGASKDGKETVFNPSYLMTLCDKVTSNMSTGFNESGFNFGRVIVYGICWGLVTIGFYFMALQLILTNIEFAVFTCLAIVLLPFGCLNKTNFLSERAISGVFSFGTKLMVVYFLLGIVASLGTTFNDAISTSPQATGADGKKADVYSFMLKQALAYLTVGYLVWKLPTLVSQMVSGGAPQLGSGITPATPFQTAATAAGTYMAAKANVKAAAGGGASSGSGSSSGGLGSATGANPVQAANQTTATSGTGSTGGSGLGARINQAKQTYNQAKQKINNTPLVNRNATKNKLSQYRSQMSGTGLKGKAKLVGKMAGLGAAQVAIDAARIAPKAAYGVAAAIFMQTDIAHSYRNAKNAGNLANDGQLID